MGFGCDRCGAEFRTPLARRGHTCCAPAVARECAQCGNRAECRACSQCQFVFYCSKDCQRRHWKVHKQTCSAPAAIVAAVPSQGDGLPEPTSRVGLVCTIAHSVHTVLSFVQHYLSLRLARIYLFFDDPDDLGIRILSQLQYPEVVIVPHDDDLRTCWRRCTSWETYQYLHSSEVQV